MTPSTSTRQAVALPHEFQPIRLGVVDNARNHDDTSFRRATVIRPRGHHKGSGPGEL